MSWYCKDDIRFMSTLVHWMSTPVHWMRYFLHSWAYTHTNKYTLAEIQVPCTTISCLASNSALYDNCMDHVSVLTSRVCRLKSIIHGASEIPMQLGTWTGNQALFSSLSWVWEWGQYIPYYVMWVCTYMYTTSMLSILLVDKLICWRILSELHFPMPHPFCWCRT